MATCETNDPLGHGRWGPEDLAREIECSTKTIQRDIEVLSQSGVPLYYDRNTEEYRVQEGFKFPGLEPNDPTLANSTLPQVTMSELTQLIEHLEQTLRHLQTLRNKLAK